MGDIRAYMTEFRALNNCARVTGEGLQEKVDLPMPDAVLDMRFAHYLGEFADDEGYLQATFQAALQVEKKKALRQAREQIKGHTAGTSGSSREKDGKRKEEKQSDDGRKAGRKTEKTGPMLKKQEPDDFGGPASWPSYREALQGVPGKDQEEYARKKGCRRCGRTGHRAARCYASTTTNGAALPPAPWKVSAGCKRGRE